MGQGLIIPEVRYGAGKHIEYIDPADFGNGLKLNFITQPLYLFAICFVKLSVGFFLLRIAVEPFYRRLIISIMSELYPKADRGSTIDTRTAFMSFYTLGCFFTLVLQCTDLRIQWSPPGTIAGTCWTAHTLKSLSYANQALNILTDIAFSIAIPVQHTLPGCAPLC